MAAVGKSAASLWASYAKAVNAPKHTAHSEDLPACIGVYSREAVLFGVSYAPGVGYKR